VLKRDHICLMSCRSTDVTLAHIIGDALFINTTASMRCAHEEVRALILEVGMDSPANGMALTAGHAAAYDKGEFAVILNAYDQYEVVAITNAYLTFDGNLLYGGRRADEIVPDGIPPMDGRLLQFQLQCAVLRNMRTSAETSFDIVKDTERLLSECKVFIQQLQDDQVVN
jgi:HNH endonuclease